MKYPKIFALILTFVIAYIVFSGKAFPEFNILVLSLGYLGVFLAGMMYSYGFTAAIATGIILNFSDSGNIFIFSIIAGVGSLLADLLIFKFIRSSFDDEIEKIKKEKIIKYFNKKIPKKILKYFFPILAGIIIASPLPDEIGVSMMAACKKVPEKIFYLLSFALNTVGILIMLLAVKFL